MHSAAFFPCVTRDSFYWAKGSWHSGLVLQRVTSASGFPGNSGVENARAKGWGGEGGEREREREISQLRWVPLPSRLPAPSVCFKSACHFSIHQHHLRLRCTREGNLSPYHTGYVSPFRALQRRHSLYTVEDEAVYSSSKQANARASCFRRGSLYFIFYFLPTTEFCGEMWLV